MEIQIQVQIQRSKIELHILETNQRGKWKREKEGEQTYFAAGDWRQGGEEGAGASGLLRRKGRLCNCYEA